MPRRELLFFFFIAATYATVGFDGCYSYLAVLALYTALIFKLLAAVFCNIVIVASGVWIFYENRQLDASKELTLMVASLPMAFLGGFLPIKENTFLFCLPPRLLLLQFSLGFNLK